MTFVVAPIVEGFGDVAALPVLLRRLVPALGIAKPVRFPRHRLVIDEHLRRAVHIAAANITARGGAILLVMDADEDCARSLGPDLDRRLAQMFPQLTCKTVLAVREFEAWIVGGHSDFAADDPDHAGDLKGRIKALHGVYSERVDQPRFIATADLERLETNSRSFRRLLKVVREFDAAAPAIN